MDFCAEILLMGLALQALALAMLVQTAQRTAMVVCYTSYHNLFLQLSFCSFCPLELYYNCTNELLFGQLVILTFNNNSGLYGRTRCNFTCCVQNCSHRVWILEAGLLPLSNSSFCFWVLLVLLFVSIII